MQEKVFLLQSTVIPNLIVMKYARFNGRKFQNKNWPSDDGNWIGLEY